jgi:hypothetical protein
MPFWPHVPLAFVVPCTFLLLIGLFTDPNPPRPVGELVPATVVAVEAGSGVRGAYAVVRVDSSDGSVICGIDGKDFPNERLPAPDTQMTVDYTPGSCAPPPVSQEIPRWVLATMGGGGLVCIAAMFQLKRTTRRRR